MDEPFQPEGFDEEASFAAAEADLRAGHHAQAEARLRGFGISSARCRDALVLMVQALIPQKRAAEAMQCAIQAIGLDDGADARVALAEAHLALREWAEAEAACRAALAIEPGYGPAQWRLGQALLARQLLPQALVAFEGAIQAMPQSVPPLLGAADTAWALEDPAGAKALLLKALALAGESPALLKRAAAWGILLPGQSAAAPSPPPRAVASPSGPLGRPSAASAHQAALARLQAKLQRGGQSEPPPPGPP